MVWQGNSAGAQNKICVQKNWTPSRLNQFSALFFPNRTAHPWTFDRETTLNRGTDINYMAPILPSKFLINEKNKEH